MHAVRARDKRSQLPRARDIAGVMHSLVALFALVALTNAQSCGEGTHLINGLCQLNPCGPGTALREGVCVPALPERRYPTLESEDGSFRFTTDALGSITYQIGDQDPVDLQDIVRPALLDGAVGGWDCPPRLLCGAGDRRTRGRTEDGLHLHLHLHLHLPASLATTRA